MYGDTGTVPVRCKIYSRMLSYFARIVNGKDSKLSFVMYKLLRKKHESDSDFFSPWIDHIKSCFGEMGMLDFWLYECTLMST